ncbi:insulinase family protein, partial [bacterium]|nr:insulinase family protein [bacterium]
LGSLLRVAPGDAAALSLLTGVLSDRLAQDLRETRGLSYSVGAGLEVHGESASFEAWLNPPAPRLAEGEAALLEAVRGFDPASITQQELDAVRNARQGRLRMRRLSSIAQAYYLSMAELDGRVGDYLDPFGAAQAVTLADLVRVGRTYLKDLPLATVVVD